MTETAAAAQVLPGPPAADAQEASEGAERVDVASAWQRPTVLVPEAALALLALLHIGASPHGIMAAGVTAVLVVLAAIDLRHRLLPNRIVLPAAALVLLGQLVFYPGQAVEWVGAFCAALFLFLPLLALPTGMGMGDVKLALPSAPCSART